MFVHQGQLYQFCIPLVTGQRYSASDFFIETGDLFAAAAVCLYTQRNTHPSSMRSSKDTSVRWFVAAMVGAFSFVSYVERMNISIAAAAMMPELRLSKIQMGQVFSSFLWGYAIFQVPAGRMGDTFGPRLTLTLAALIWCAMSALTGFLPGSVFSGAFGVVTSLLILRFLLGAGEA